MTDAEILLLADPSPALRRRVLVELLDAPEDDAEAADLSGRVEAEVPEDGDLRTLSFALCRLAYLGLDRADPRVEALAERVFAVQQPDGSFPLHAFTRKDTPYSAVPLQTALPLRGLAAAGFGEDARAERAYEWLLAHRLPDGAWPSGLTSRRRAFVAGYRRLPGSVGCRANTTGALACLALHPERRRSDPARTALDLLLQRETREEWAFGWEVARLVGVEPPCGFFTFYARFDLAFVLDLAARVAAAPDDPRVADLAEFVLSLRGPNGLWAHPSHPELSRWLTFDLLSSLRRLEAGDWVGTAFRTPFRAYPRRRRRY